MVTQPTDPFDEAVGMICIGACGATGFVWSISGGGVLDFLWSAPLTLPLGLILLHFLMDFIFQSDWMALNKSKEWWPLIWHVVVYSTGFGWCLGW